MLLTSRLQKITYSTITSIATLLTFFFFLQIRTLQCNTIFKTILFEERLNKITIYFKRQQNKTKTFTVYRVHYLKFIEKR